MNPNETRGTDIDEEEESSPTCPSCGMEQKNWPNPQGVDRGGELYCCKGCAEGIGCICEEESAKQTHVSSGRGSASGNERSKKRGRHSSTH